MITKAAESARSTLRSDLASSFASVRFTLAFLLAKSPSETACGQELLANPQRFLPDQRAEIEQALTALAQEVATSINAFVDNEETEAADRDETYDPKVAFKSRSGVLGLEREVVRLGRRLARSDPSYFFEVQPKR